MVGWAALMFLLEVDSLNRKPSKKSCEIKRIERICFIPENYTGLRLKKFFVTNR